MMPYFFFFSIIPLVLMAVLIIVGKSVATYTKDGQYGICIKRLSDILKMWNREAVEHYFCSLNF